MKQKVAIYWARRDFRLRDNPALSSALRSAEKESRAFLPVFIVEDYMTKADSNYQFGYPSRYFLSQSLPAFAKHFEKFLILRGKGAQSLASLAEELDIQIFVNEDIYPDFYTQVEKIKKRGIAIQVLPDQMTVKKDTKTGAGNLYSVFTPFKNTVWQDFMESAELPKAPVGQALYLQDEYFKKLKHQVPIEQATLWKNFSQTRTFSALGRVFDIDTIVPGKPVLDGWYLEEATALKKFQNFLKDDLAEYKKERDFLDKEKTSKMSLALAWGLVSSRTLKNMIKKECDHDFENPYSTRYEGATHYLSELIWRDFYKYLFFHTPQLMQVEFQAKFRKKITWVQGKEAEERFLAWMSGKTGYAVVDAAMKELAETGYMHNRARMIVASVLTKNLGIDWRAGQEYFRAMLIDLDESSNNGGWQWGASVGADPKPIRIFNPYLQAEKYDKGNRYQEKWLGKENLAKYQKKETAGVASTASETGKIVPIVPHKRARQEALERYGLKTGV